MRICFVNSNIPWGGGERWIHQFARLSRDHDHTVTVLANVGSALAERLLGEPGISLETMPLGNFAFLNPRAQRHLTDLFTSRAVDTVLMCLPRDLKAAGFAARRVGVPRIVYRRGIDVSVKNSWLNRHLYGQVLTGLICNTEATKRSVLANNPDLIPDERISVVGNGFDVAEFDARPVVPLLTAADEETVIGCAARLVTQKGLSLLLDATALLLDRGHRVRVALAGSGPLEATLKAQAHSLDIAAQVDFLGFVDDIKSFYAGIDILALPSLFEGFGYVLVEAGRCEKPSVAFNASSNPEVVVDGVTGLLAEPGNTQDFADKLEQLLLNPGLRVRLGQAAFHHAAGFDTAIKYREFEQALGF